MEWIDAFRIRQSMYLLNHLQRSEIIWAIPNRILWQHVISCSVVSAAQQTASPRLQKWYFWRAKPERVRRGRPSDERWLPSTSAGIRPFYHLITLQSSTGTLLVVNYFAKQRGGVPRRTVQQAPEWDKDADTKLKSVRAGKRLGNGGKVRKMGREDEEEMARGRKRKACQAQYLLWDPVQPEIAQHERSRPFRFQMAEVRENILMEWGFHLRYTLYILYPILTQVQDKYHQFGAKQNGCGGKT